MYSKQKKVKHVLLVILCLFIAAVIVIIVYLPRDSKTPSPSPDILSPTPVIDTKENEAPTNKQLSFSDLDGIEFWFGSGVGAWRTTLYIQSDGSFTGRYCHGETGMGYRNPLGRIDECRFHGVFSSLKESGPYQYSLKCDSLEMEGTVGDIRFENDYAYVTTDPYGMEKADEFELYLPGKQTSELPSGFIEWSNGMAQEDQLPCYGLYNVGGETGFIVWPESEDEWIASEPSAMPESEFSPETIAAMQKEYSDADDLHFSDLKGIEFMATKGMGFAVTVTIDSDGTFHGCYDESFALGLGDDVFPCNNRYLCNYTGQFSGLTKTGPYEYTMKCISLVPQGTVGEERIEGDTKIITTEPYGFLNADEFKLYLPGTDTSKLPQGFLKWHSDYLSNGVTNEYILYNVGGEEGFVVPAG